jgi:hypothetical protein
MSPTATSIGNTCPMCQGNGDVPNPQGTLYQLCPLCNGLGTWPGQGLAYFYALDFTLTNQSPTLGTVLIRTGTDFLWKFAIAERTGTFTYLLDQNGNQFQTVYNSQGIASGQGLQDVNFWGTGQNPFPLPDPIPLGEQVRLDVVVTDTSGASGGSPNNINLFFVGAQFPAGALVSNQSPSGTGN